MAFVLKSFEELLQHSSLKGLIVLNDVYDCVDYAAISRGFKDLGDK